VISRLSFGWQTTIADLALILFMVTAAGSRAQEQRPAVAESVESPPAQGEPLAVYRSQAGAPPLSAWLAEQAPDRRQRLTIVARYAPGDAATAARAALDLAREAGTGGGSARIVLEPGTGLAVLATLAFDQPAPAVARPLQHVAQD
jgi:hypothetical protein